MFGKLFTAITGMPTSIEGKGIIDDPDLQARFPHAFKQSAESRHRDACGNDPLARHQLAQATNLTGRK